MAESKSLKKAVHVEAKQAEHEAKTGNVKTVPEKSIGDWREQQAGADLPTNTRRSHPPA